MPKCLGLLAVCGSLLCAATAGATVYEQFQFDDEYTDTFEDCGLTLRAVGTVSGNIVTRVGRQEGTFFGHVNYTYNEVVTNLATGKSLLSSGRGTVQETKATQVEGTIFEFSSVEAGQPFVVRDLDGNLILRDRGAVRSTILFDTLGDDVPGGDFIDVVRESLSGPHPGFDDESRCALILPYLT
jgi:hypothetical protein